MPLGSLFRADVHEEFLSLSSALKLTFAPSTLPLPFSALNKTLPDDDSPALPPSSSTDCTTHSLTDESPAGDGDKAEPPCTVATSFTLSTSTLASCLSPSDREWTVYAHELLSLLEVAVRRRVSHAPPVDCVKHPQTFSVATTKQSFHGSAESQGDLKCTTDDSLKQTPLMEVGESPVASGEVVQVRGLPREDPQSECSEYSCHMQL